MWVFGARARTLFPCSGCVFFKWQHLVKVARARRITTAELMGKLLSALLLHPALVSRELLPLRLQR